MTEEQDTGRAGQAQDKHVRRVLAAEEILRREGWTVAKPGTPEEALARGGDYLAKQRAGMLESFARIVEQYGGRLAVEWDDDRAAAPLDLTWAADLDGLDVPEVPFTVEGVVPAQAVTILYGPGKVGKSLLTLQLALAVATGGEWLGHRVLRPGKAIYLGAEDSPASMHKRLSLILDAHGLTFADVPDLGFKSLLGEDTVLARPGPRGGGEVDFTATYRRVVATVERERPALMVLDTLNRLTTIDINSAVAAAQFVQRLGELAYTADCAIYLLAHPSLTAMRSGEMSGGSPALFNTARAKHVLRRPASRAEGEGVPGARVFWAEHVNDAPESAPQTVRQVGGAFRLIEGAALAAEREHDLAAQMVAYFEEIESRIPSGEIESRISREDFARQFRDQFQSEIADLKLPQCREAINGLIEAGVLAEMKGEYDSRAKRSKMVLTVGEAWDERPVLRRRNYDLDDLDDPMLQRSNDLDDPMLH